MGVEPVDGCAPFFQMVIDCADRAVATRTCPACGYRFDAGPDVYCSGICSGSAGIAAVIAGIHRFAEAQAGRSGHGLEAQGQGAAA